MAKLFKLTTLQDALGCNFNVLINGYPKVLGVRGILRECLQVRNRCITDLPQVKPAQLARHSNSDSLVGRDKNIGIGGGETGRGSLKIRGKYRYLKAENVIEIYEIPYTTTSEVIIDKVEDLIKTGKIREINDMRDEYPAGLSGDPAAGEVSHSFSPGSNLCGGEHIPSSTQRKLSL